MARAVVISAAILLALLVLLPLWVLSLFLSMLAFAAWILTSGKKE